MALTTERIRELWENYSPTRGIESFARSVEAAARRDALEQAEQLVEKATYRKRWVKAAVNGQANNVPPCELAAAIRKLKEDTQ